MSEQREDDIYGEANDNLLFYGSDKSNSNNNESNQDIFIGNFELYENPVIDNYNNYVVYVVNKTGDSLALKVPNFLRNAHLEGSIKVEKVLTEEKEHYDDSFNGSIMTESGLVFRNLTNVSIGDNGDDISTIICNRLKGEVFFQDRNYVISYSNNNLIGEDICFYEKDNDHIKVGIKDLYDFCTNSQNLKNTINNLKRYIQRGNKWRIRKKISNKKTKNKELNYFIGNKRKKPDDKHDRGSGSGGAASTSLIDNTKNEMEKA